MPSENQRANRLPFKVCLIPKEFYQIKSYFSTYIYNFLKLNQFWVTPYNIHTVINFIRIAKDTHQSGECPLNPLFMRFVDYLKYLLRRPSKALPWRASSQQTLYLCGILRFCTRICTKIFLVMRENGGVFP